MTKRTLTSEEKKEAIAERRRQILAANPDRIIGPIQVEDETDDDGEPVFRTTHTFEEKDMPKDWKL